MSAPSPCTAAPLPSLASTLNTNTTNTSKTSLPPSDSPPMRIAILLNSYKSPFITEIRDSYIRTLSLLDTAHTGTLNLTFFYPADDPTSFPDPALFDLIVIGGGNADPRKRHPWILRVHRFILEVVERWPGKKLCGICWGHQTISLLFGGEIVDMDAPEMGVTEAKLTSAGVRFMEGGPRKDGIVRLQQHHRRKVGKAPRGFTELIGGNQAFLSHNNGILTFQGHPEKDARAAKLRIRDAARWYGTDMSDQRAVNELLRGMEVQHDGREIWEIVMQWARESTHIRDSTL